MMKLSDIFESLRHGEFSQLALGGGEADALPDEKYPAVVSHINLGLMALYKRFTLKEGQLVLTLAEGRELFVLDNAFAVNNPRSREPVRYIEDSPAQPFKNDVMKVERVLTDNGFEMSLNNRVDPYSCFTPSLNSLRIPLVLANDTMLSLPDHLKTHRLTVVYRARHPEIKIGISYFDPARVTIELPATHLEALLYFVASRVHNPVGMSNEFHMGNSYYAKYEAECQRLEHHGAQVDQGEQNSRLRRNGWV